MSFIFFDKECGNLNKPIFRNSNAQWGYPGRGVWCWSFVLIDVFYWKALGESFPRATKETKYKSLWSHKGLKPNHLSYQRHLHTLSLTEKNAFVRTNMFPQPVMGKSIIPVPWKEGHWACKKTTNAVKDSFSSKVECQSNSVAEIRALKRNTGLNRAPMTNCCHRQ